jgi:hypothetical protein
MRVPRHTSRGANRAAFCWLVGTRTNRPGLRPATLRYAVLIPSHLLRSLVAGDKADFAPAKTAAAPARCAYQGIPRRGAVHRAAFCWLVGTRTNRPGLRPAALRYAVLIPSHLLRSLVAGDKADFAQRKRPQPRPDARTKAYPGAARTERRSVGSSVPERTGRGFGPLRFATRSSSPATSFDLSWLGIRPISRSENGRSPGPMRVPRHTSRGANRAAFCWLVGTRTNRPGLRPATLRYAVLIPSHLLRSLVAGAKGGFAPANTPAAPARRAYQGSLPFGNVHRGMLLERRYETERAGASSPLRCAYVGLSSPATSCALRGRGFGRFRASEHGRSPGQTRVPRLPSVWERTPRNVVGTSVRDGTSRASARFASLRGPHPQPPPALCVAGG